MKLQFLGRPLGDYEVKALKGNQNLQVQYGQRPGLPNSPRHVEMPSYMDEGDDPMLRPRNLKIQSVDEAELDQELRHKLDALQNLKQEAVM